MNRKVAQKMERALLVIRDGYRARASLRPYSDKETERAYRYLDEICGRIYETGTDAEQDFMFVCLGALDELMGENDNAKTADFAVW